MRNQRVAIDLAEEVRGYLEEPDSSHENPAVRCGLKVGVALVLVLAELVELLWNQYYGDWIDEEELDD